MTAESKPSLAGLLGKSAPAEEEAEGEDYEGGKQAAAQAAIDALKSGDASALSSALSDFVALCT